MINKSVFLEEMQFLLNWFGKPRDEAIVRRLYESLGDRLTTDEFRAACRAVFESEKFFPPPNVFVEKVRGNAASRAAEQWAKVLKAATGYPVELDAAAKAALRELGGIAELGRIDESQLPWLRKDFIPLYQSYAEQDHTKTNLLPGVSQ